MEELRTDLEQAIISSVDHEFGGVKHRLCQWHMTRALSRRLNSKGKNGYRVLDEKIMRTKMHTLYNLLQTLPIIPIRKVKQSVLLHQIIDRERRKLKKKFGKTSLLYVELARYIEYVECTYLDPYNATFNPRNWAIENVSVNETYIVTSINESVNSIVGQYVKKNQSEVNNVRGLQQVQMRFIINEEYRSFNFTKKKKKRKVAVRNILFKTITSKIEDLNLDNDDGTLNESNEKLYKSFVKDLMEVPKLAKTIVKRDEEGTDYNFQVWIKSHINSNPEHKNVLSSYVSENNDVPFVPMSELLDSLQETMTSKKANKESLGSNKKVPDSMKRGVESTTQTSSKAKRRKLTQIAIDKPVSPTPRSPLQKVTADARENDNSPRINLQSETTTQSLTKGKLDFSGEKSH